MDQLVACRVCSVHVRVSETECPFCGAAAPSRSVESGARARTSRATLHRLHAAAMATCAIACTHDQPATVTIAPTASSTPVATATVTATATAVTTSKHAAGESCTADGECASGLNCCETGISGKCGGARQANVQYPPCVILRTCVAQPCRPMPMPPYGAAFPEDESLTV